MRWLSSLSSDRVLPAEADGSHGGQLERREVWRLQGSAEQEEELSDGLGAGGAGGHGSLQQGHEPTDAVHGHQRGVPGAHTGCAQPGQTGIKLGSNRGQSRVSDLCSVIEHNIRDGFILGLFPVMSMPRTNQIKWMPIGILQIFLLKRLSFCFPQGLHDEEGPQKEELARALVCASAKLDVVLCERGPRWQEGRHCTGSQLLCRGNTISVTTYRHTSCTVLSLYVVLLY